MSDTKQQCPTCHSPERDTRCRTYGYSCGCQNYVPYKRCKLHEALCKGSEECRDPWHDSPVEGSAPAAAGSGAQEWREQNVIYPLDRSNWVNGIPVFRLVNDEYVSLDVLLTKHADHCTAQLREQLTAVDELFTKHMKGLLDAIGMYGVPDSPDTKVQTLDEDGIEELRLCVVGKIEELKAELTVERTRREAAERALEAWKQQELVPLDELRERAEAAERELKELREALRQISVLETNIGDLAGSCAKRIARAALRGKEGE